MPRQILPVMSLEDVQTEVLFTRAALKADPDARDLLSVTDPWLAWVDNVAQVMRRAAEAQIDADASRIIGNVRLDIACTSFADDLVRAVDKDTKSARWRQFFKTNVSTFVRTSLGEQAATVKSWFAIDDAVLRQHKPALETWTNTVTAALTQTTNSGAIRGSAWVTREQVAEDLTRARDGLHAALVERAREKRLPRDWPNAFFRVERRRGGSAEGEVVQESEGVVG